MSSFNQIKKYKYQDNQQDPLCLLEYISYKSDLRLENYLVFKFRNNVNQRLYSFKVEVLQYDKNDNLLEKSILTYENFVCKANEEFVPNAKMKANYNTTKIDVKVLYALYERTVYNNSEFNPVDYGANEVRKDFNKHEVKEAKKAAVVRTKELKKASKPSSKRVTKVKNYMHYNVPGGPKVFAIIMSILVIGFFIGTGIMKFMEDPAYYSDNYFDYVDVSATEAKIINYSGFGSTVTIPDKVDGKKVVKISKGTFQNSGIKKVIIKADKIQIEERTFEGCNKLEEVVSTSTDMVIGSYAFANCVKLTKVDMNASKVGSYAFSGCTSLRYADFNEATLESNCLEGCTNLNTLLFSKTNVTLFYELFGKKQADIPKLTTIECGLAKVTQHFFGSIPSVTEYVPTNSECKYETGSLSGMPNIKGYIDAGVFEMLNSKIISQSTYFTYIAISEAYKYSDYKDIILENANNIKKITVLDSQVAVTTSYLSQFPNLETLVLGSGALVPQTLYQSACPNLKTLEISTNSDATYTSSAFVNLTCNKLILTGDGTKTYNYSSNLNNIQYVEVKDETQMLKLGFIPNIYELIMPLGNQVVNNMGVSTNLTVLTLLESKYDSIPANYLVSYKNLTSLTLPENIVGIDSNAFSNLTSLDTLVIPDSVKALGDGFIGLGCSISNLTIPFIGNDSNTARSYTDMNLSYKYTKNLKVTKNTTLTKSTFRNVGEVDSIIFAGDVNYQENANKSTIASVNYVEFKGKTNFDSLSSISLANITTLVINSENAVLKDNFVDCKVQEVIILKANKVEAKSILSSAIELIYVGTVTTDSLDYLTIYNNYKPSILVAGNKLPTGVLGKTNITVKTLRGYSLVFSQYYQEK